MKILIILVNFILITIIVFTLIFFLGSRVNIQSQSTVEDNDPCKTTQSGEKTK